MIKHGHTRHGTISPEYRAWNAMIQRCHNPNSLSRKYYGGRGIVVCKEWRKSFIPFFKHIGQRPSPRHSIDRINNDGNYEPGNVRWATKRQQVMNRRPFTLKTHCFHGHIFDEKNTAILKTGRRDCLKCRGIWNRENYAKRVRDKATGG